ncbi:MAG: diguanylate cyclase [Gammaproteobacteria bacterium]|nr:diguanylate cyclase [Gammaproteobacteria bacterium]
MNHPTGDWKSRYFDSLAELEQKERQWQSVESSLRRCISRLTFIGDGIDVQLDQRLEQLRNRVRGEQNIKALLDAVDEITRRAERASEIKAQNPAFSAEELMAQLITEANLPKALEKRAQGLTKALKAAPIKPEVLQHAKALLLEAMTPPAAQEREASAGLFGRLFAKDKADDDKPAKEVATAEQTDLSRQIEGQRLFLFLLDRLSQLTSAAEQFNTLAARAGAAENSQELEDLALELVQLISGESAETRIDSLPPVDQVLLQLVERLDLTPELQPRVQGLKRQLSKGIVQDDILPLLTELLQLVEHARLQAVHERQEVEMFLLQMTEQLQKLDQEINSISNTGSDLIEGGRNIDREMQQQVADLQETVAQSVDLSDLKFAITNRLTLIQERLRGHRGDTEQLVHEFERRIALLTSQLGEMEQERGRLQETVEKARAEAFTDALTGLSNRHAFDRRLQEEYARWSRYGNPLSLIVIDVDHFKKVNDTYGHLAGDKVLHVIGAHLKNSTRTIDFTARFGGEEFVVLLPDTDIGGAKSVAEKIRQAVEQKPFRSGSSRVNITVSCGVASFQQGDGRKAPFERADEALYLAKRSGRNRCCSEVQEKSNTDSP